MKSGKQDIVNKATNFSPKDESINGLSNVSEGFNFIKTSFDLSQSNQQFKDNRNENTAIATIGKDKFKYTMPKCNTCDKFVSESNQEIHVTVCKDIKDIEKAVQLLSEMISELLKYFNQKSAKVIKNDVSKLKKILQFSNLLLIESIRSTIDFHQANFNIIAPQNLSVYIENQNSVDPFTFDNFKKEIKQTQNEALVNEGKDKIEQGQQEQEQEQEQCMICLEAYQINDIIVNLDCKHRFHKDCISRWLTNHDTCPICRNKY